MFDNDMLITVVEFMFYSQNIKTGVIYTYYFFESNIGVKMQIKKEVNIFFPSNYIVAKDIVPKVSCITIFAVTVLFQICSVYKYMVAKTRTLFKQGSNDFETSDITQLIQIVMAVVTIGLGVYLFAPIAIEPVNIVLGPSESDFQYWVRWSEIFKTFRTILGLYGITQVFNFLLICSRNLPSLGIVFETAKRSRSDIIMFTMIFQFLFISMVIACHLMFGMRSVLFADLQNCYMTCLRMMFGEYFYDKMYAADPVSSAFTFFLFTIFFSFLCLYMYIAIITRTYAKIRAQRLFISEAMARITLEKFKTTLNNWTNLILFRDPSREKYLKLMKECTDKDTNDIQGK